VPVSTEVIEANYQDIRGRSQPASSRVVLAFEWKGVKYYDPGYLAGRTTFVAVGDHVDIRIDPDHPELWTARTAPPVFGRELLGSGILAAMALTMLAVAWLLHRGVLETWRRGEAFEATVLEQRHTALAPRSRLLRCTPVQGDDHRIFSVFVPLSKYAPAVGDAEEGAESIWVLRLAGGRPLALSWFD
jgi:hypothetical protein